MAPAWQYDTVARLSWLDVRPCVGRLLRQFSMLDGLPFALHRPLTPAERWDARYRHVVASRTLKNTTCLRRLQ